MAVSSGRRYDKREYDAFGIPFDESRERFDEGMLLLRKAMAEEDFTFEGKFYPISSPGGLLRANGGGMVSWAPRTSLPEDCDAISSG